MAPMKPKFQPIPKSTSAPKKLPKVTPDRATTPRTGEDQEAQRDDPLRAEAGDQMAGEEGGREHRHHMGRDDVAGRGSR